MRKLITIFILGLSVLVSMLHAQLHNKEPRLGIATIDGLFSPKQGEKLPSSVTLTEGIFLDTLTVRVSQYGSFSIVMPLCREVPCRLSWAGGSLWLWVSPQEATICSGIPCNIDSVSLSNDCIALDCKLRALLADSVTTYREQLNSITGIMNNDDIMLCPSYANLCQWLMIHHIIAPQKIVDELKVRWLKQQIWQNFSYLDKEQLQSMNFLPQPYKDYIEIHRMHMLKRQKIAVGDSVLKKCECEINLLNTN